MSVLPSGSMLDSNFEQDVQIVELLMYRVPEDNPS